MNIKKVFIAALTAVNAVSLAAAAAFTCAGYSLVKDQRSDKAAERWAPDGSYMQISSFFSEDAGFGTDRTEGVKAKLTADLKNISITAEENTELIPEGYSSDAGTMSVRGDSAGRAEASVTAVGGSFFRFRDFRLADGAFFSESDIMQDGAVIDRQLAWQIYGSEKVSGKNIYIDGTKFYIAGVIECPESKQEKRTAGDAPRAYISYEGYKLIIGGENPDIPDENGGSRAVMIDSYECLVPNPVENYAYNAVKEYFESEYGDKCVIVNNTERFRPSVRASEFKNLAEYAVSENKVVYPFWENASRIVEFKLSEIYFFRRLTYIIPAITALMLLVIFYRAAGRFIKKSTSWVVDFFMKVNYNRNQKKLQEQSDREEAEKNKSE